MQPIPRVSAERQPTQTHKEEIITECGSRIFLDLPRAAQKAYKEKLLTENVNDFLEYIEWDDVVKEFLNQDELIRLAQTPCDSDVLRRASLFSCLTGLRFSDILNLEWKNIQEIAGIGLCVVIKTQKTKTAATLPLCEDAIELIGERKTGKVFPGFQKHLRQNL